MKPSITSSLSASGNVDQKFSYQIQASENANAYRASGLPRNLDLHATTGVISGTPSERGRSSVTLWASNSNGESDSVILVITVA